MDFKTTEKNSDIMQDFYKMNKFDFLKQYNHLTIEEYDRTLIAVAEVKLKEEVNIDGDFDFVTIQERHIEADRVILLGWYECMSNDFEYRYIKGCGGFFK